MFYDLSFQVHFLYQFSLQFFLDIFSAVLHNNSDLNDVKEYNARLSIISNGLFQVDTPNNPIVDY